MTDHVAKGIVHANFVVEPIKTCANEIAIEPGIVDLADELDVGIVLANLRDDPPPELYRYHEHHVATKCIDTFGSPVEQHVEHLLPRVRHGCEVPYATGIVVNAVVQFHGFIPIITARGIAKMVVASSLGRKLYVFACPRLIALSHLAGAYKRLTRTIVEVVLWREALGGVVVLSEVTHALRLGNAFVLACYVIGHKVEDHLQASTMGAGNKSVELVHSFVDIHGQIGVDIIVVGNSIGRTCTTLYHGRVLGWNAKTRVVGHRSVPNDTCIPHVRHTKFTQMLQHRRGKIGHFATTVFLDSTILLTRQTAIAVKARKHLIDD